MEITNNNQNNELNELVDADGSFIDGDKTTTNDSEIETGPVHKTWDDESDYEKGVSTTTDRASRYRQTIPWFAVYSYRDIGGRGLAVNENRNILTKKQIEEEIKEELVKRKDNNDIFDKDWNVKKENLIDLIDDSEFSDKQLERLKNLVLKKLNKNG